MGIWGWVKEKSSQFASGISTTYTAVTSTIKTIWTWAYSENYAIGTATQFWEGFTRVLDPNNVTRLIRSPHTRQTLTESFKANVVYYLSFAMLLEVTRQAILTRTLSGEETWTDSAVELTIDSFVMLAMGAMMVRRYYDNTLLNLALSKQVGEENPLSNHFASCRCDSGALIKSAAFSPLHLSSKLGSLWVASYLPVIKHVVPLGYTFAYGESLAEFPHTAAGTCAEHRAQRLSQFNSYSFGLGCAMFAVGEGISYLLSEYTGVNSVFISNAIYAAIYPYFVTAVLLRDRPLMPTSGIDLSHYHRYVTDRMIVDIGGKIIPLLRAQNKKFDLKEWAMKAYDNQVVQSIHWSLSRDFYGDWFSFKKFVLNNPNKIFLKEYYDAIIKEINKIIDLRDKPLLERPISEIPMAAIAPIVPSLPSRVTKLFMTREYKNLIKIIFEDWLEDPLMVTRQILVEIRKMQQAAQIKTVTHDEASWQNNGDQQRTTPRIEIVPDTESLTSSMPVLTVQAMQPAQPLLSASSAAPARSQAFDQPAPLSKSEIPSASRHSLFAQTRQRSVIDEQEIVKKRHLFLSQLKRDVNLKIWDTKGDRLFTTSVPTKIGELRKTLTTVHQEMAAADINRLFQEVVDTFKLLPANNKRDPQVREFYANIIDRIRKIKDDQSDTQSFVMAKSQ